MNALTTLPDAVQWAEGMLLTPQHFQQHDIHWGASLLHRLRGVNSHYWGVTDLEIDLALLPDNLVDIKALSCVFPDGTPFVLTPDSVKPLRLEIRPAQLSDDKALRICVAMPPRIGAMNVQTTSIRRYESIPGSNPVIDEMTGFADVFVDRIRPIVSLHAEADVPAGYQTIPLLEICRNAKSAQPELTIFNPPMLRMGAARNMPQNSSMLYALKNLRDEMWEKMHMLTGLVQADGPEDEANMSEEERIQLGLARHIASSLTMFDAIMLDPETPPSHAYRALAHVVGSMAWVGSNPAPLVMLPYAHENCAPQFLAAIEYVSHKLALINTSWEGLVFKAIGEHGFLLRLPDHASAPLLIEVRLRQGQNLNDVKAWLSDSRIASDDLMPLMQRRRLPGAAWRILTSAETAQLGLRSDSIIVRLENQRIEVPQQGLVDCFRPGRGLLIHCESPQLRPSAVILQIHRNPQTAAGIGYQA